MVLQVKKLISSILQVNMVKDMINLITKTTTNNHMGQQVNMINNIKSSGTNTMHNNTSSINNLQGNKLQVNRLKHKSKFRIQSNKHNLQLIQQMLLLSSFNNNHHMIRPQVTLMISINSITRITTSNIMDSNQEQTILMLQHITNSIMLNNNNSNLVKKPEMKVKMYRQYNLLETMRLNKSLDNEMLITADSLN